MWNQIVHIDSKLEEVARDPETKAKFQAARKRLEMGLGQRTKSMLSMTEYVEVINRILKMPGMHAEFISRNFEVFSKGRTVEFNVDLLYDIIDYWVELLGNEDKFHVVTQYTIQTLRRYSEGDKRSELERDTFQSIFFKGERVMNGTDESTSEVLFPGIESDQYRLLHRRFISMTKKCRAPRSFQSLNTGTKNSLSSIKHVVSPPQWGLRPIKPFLKAARQFDGVNRRLNNACVVGSTIAPIAILCGN